MKQNRSSEAEDLHELVLHAKNHRNYRNMSFIALANSIIGVSILSIPFCFQKCGILLSILLLLVSNYITRKCCYFLLKCSIITRRKNFEGLGFFAFGKNGKTLVELCVIGYLMGTCVAFYVVIGDLAPEILGKFIDINANHVGSLRVWLIIVITLVLVIPLSFQKNVDSLSFVCSASIGFYICLVLKTISESTITLKLDDKWTSNVEIWSFSGLLQCLPIFSMALSCQLQLFEVYDSQPFGSIEKMYNNVKTATSICTVVYIFIGFFGYIAFYTKELSGNILVNFTQSIASDAIKVGFVLSVACSIPLIILPCRTCLISFLQRRTHSNDSSGHKFLTLCIVLSTMVIGIYLPSIEVVIGLIGSTIGVLICIIFPAATFLKINQKNSKEKLISQIFVIMGFVIMILGTYANLNAIDASKSGSHLDEKSETMKLVANQNLKKLEIDNKYKNLAQDINHRKIEKPPPAPPTKNTTINNVELLRNKIKESEANKLKNEQADVVALPPLPVESEVINKPKNEPGKAQPPLPVESEVINKDAIAKEEQEIAINRQEIQDKNEEIKELKETKSEIEKDLKEIKQELKKQNEETQKLVLEKFEEIAEKVERIEKANEENLAADKSKTAEVKPVKEEKNKNKVKEVVDGPVAEQDDRNDPVLVMLTNNLSNINKSEALSYQMGEEVAQKKINLSDILKPKEPEVPKAVEVHVDALKVEEKLKDEGTVKEIPKVEGKSEKKDENLVDEKSSRELRNEIRRKRETGPISQKETKIKTKIQVDRSPELRVVKKPEEIEVKREKIEGNQDSLKVEPENKIKVEKSDKNKILTGKEVGFDGKLLSEIKDQVQKTKTLEDGNCEKNKITGISTQNV